ncbi:MAG: hypothetical protein CMD92_00290 [Gammaproteobacteria bacterium]|nr:hypothetical protein [Gammaproteobacteria bacterium]
MQLPRVFVRSDWTIDDHLQTGRRTNREPALKEIVQVNESKVDSSVRKSGAHGTPIHQARQMPGVFDGS